MHTPSVVLGPLDFAVERLDYRFRILLAARVARLMPIVAFDDAKLELDTMSVAVERSLCLEAINGEPNLFLRFDGLNDDHTLDGNTPPEQLIERQRHHLRRLADSSDEKLARIFHKEMVSE